MCASEIFVDLTPDQIRMDLEYHPCRYSSYGNIIFLPNFTSNVSLHPQSLQVPSHVDHSHTVKTLQKDIPIDTRSLKMV